MNETQTFKEFLATQTPHVDLATFVRDLFLAIVLAWILGRIYIRFGQALSNRRAFAQNFVPLTATTTLVIAIVKSSLALSLGLVGALSIVRFRAAIKEPEELGFLFISIAIGLGFGAGQVAVTLVAFVVLTAALALLRRTASRSEHQNLQVSWEGKTSLSEVVDVLRTHAATVRLARVDESDRGTDASFLVEFDSFDEMEKATSAIRSLEQGARITVLDTSGIG